MIFADYFHTAKILNSVLQVQPEKFMDELSSKIISKVPKYQVNNTGYYFAGYLFYY